MSILPRPTQEKTAAVTWAEANQAYLRAELHRLRLLLQRKVRWLRRNWQRDPLGNGQGLVISEALADRLLSGDEAESETRFYREDTESAAITSLLEEVDAYLHRLRQGIMEEGGLPSLEVLSRLFGLRPFDRDVLLLCLASEEDPGFAALYAYAQDDVHARYPNMHLAVSLFCPAPDEREVARGAFLPSSPLRQFRLVSFGDGSAGAPQSLRPLRIDDRVADYLRGINRLDEDVVHLLRPVPPAPVAGAHRELVDGLVRWARSAAADSGWPPFHLTGPTDAGKQAVAREFCACIGLHLYALDAKRLPLRDADRHSLLHLMEREAVLSHMAVYLDVTDVDPVDRALMMATRDWIERAGGVLFVGSRERWQFQRHAIHVPVPRPDLTAQRSLWAAALGSAAHAIDGHLDSIVQQFDLGPQAIRQVVTAALARARLRSAGDATLAAADLWHACREQVGWRAGELAQRLDPCYTWDDIVLPEDVRRQLREIADQVAARPQVYEVWGFGACLPRGRGISALFSGPSGTGKTMAAEILANHLQLDLYRIDLAGVISKYIGETEKNLRNVFDAAEQSGAILFFDEADALFGKRSEVKDSHDRYANIEINYLLQRMEEYRGLAILCTNRRSALDRAFLRRLRFLVEFPLPDWERRRLIWQKVFPPQAPLGFLDVDALSRLEISGGNIRNIALNAAFLAAGAGISIGMAHVLHAARREYSKIDKLPTEAEFGAHYRLMKA
jgi:AAA+ superfamily predicted ATPase